jgi:TctA family transporter
MAVIVLLELVALLAIVRLWQEKRRNRFSKLAWSVLLLIPILGFIFYGFLKISPDSQEDHTEDSVHARIGGLN